MKKTKKNKYGFASTKSQEKVKNKYKEGGQINNVLFSLKCFGCQGYGHMKQNPSYYFEGY